MMDVCVGHEICTRNKKVVVSYAQRTPLPRKGMPLLHKLTKLLYERLIYLVVLPTCPAG